MSTAEIADLVARILATAFLAVACGGIVWGIAEFVVVRMQVRKAKKKKKKRDGV
jgi:hypothetical protein